MPYPHFPASTKSKRFYPGVVGRDLFCILQLLFHRQNVASLSLLSKKYLGELQSLVSSAQNSSAKTCIVISIKLNNIHSIHIPFVRMLYSEAFSPRQEPFNCVDSPNTSILTSSCHDLHILIIIFNSSHKLHSVTFIVFLIEFTLDGQ